MTLSEITTSIRNKTGIKNTGAISTSDIWLFVNEGYDLIQNLLMNVNQDFFEEQNTKFSLVANSALYALPSDFLGLEQLRLAYTTPTDQEDYVIATPYDVSEVEDVEVQEEDISEDNPIYDLTNVYIRIKPTPTSSVLHGAELFYFAKPDKLAHNSAVPYIPANYHPYLVDYGAAEVCNRFQLFAQADRFRKTFQEKIGVMTETEADRIKDNPTRIKNITETYKLSRTELI